MSRIGPKTLDAVAETTRKLLNDNFKEIDEAYLNDDGKVFSVGVKLNFKPGSNGGIFHWPTLTFIKEKIKDDGIGEETDENGPVGDALFDAQERMDAEDRAERERERARIHEILFRDFRPFARLIGSVLAKWRRAYQNVGAILFRKHLKI